MVGLKETPKPADSESVRPKIRQAWRDEAGFTLVELLIVMIILASLAAVALAAFISQKQKATDTKAKSMAHTAMVTMESCGVESNGGYEPCDAERLRSMESTLPPAPILEVSGLATDEYTIAVESVPPGRIYTVRRSGGGGIEFTCVVKGEGGCPASGTWGS